MFPLGSKREGNKKEVEPNSILFLLMGLRLPCVMNKKKKQLHFDRYIELG